MSLKQILVAGADAAGVRLVSAGAKIAVGFYASYLASAIRGNASEFSFASSYVAA